MTTSRALLIGWLGMLSASLGYGEAIRFAVVGDSQGEVHATNEIVFPQIVEQVLKIDPPVQFVVVVGDLITGSHDDEQMLADYVRWRELAEPWYASDMIGLKVYALPGNHDLRDRDTSIEVWQTSFPELPDNGPDGERKMTYSFDMGPCHMTMVCTDHPDARGKVNLEWLVEDLSASDAPIKLVFGHDPAYPYLGHIGSSLDRYPELRDQFWQILVDHGVKAYFCGHVHLFDHWIHDGVHQIITGGGGGLGFFMHFLVVDADEQDVTVAVHRETGEFTGQFKLSETEGVDNEDRSDPNRTVWDSIPIPCVSEFGPVLLGVILAFGGLVGTAMRQER